MLYSSFVSVLQELGLNFNDLPELPPPSDLKMGPCSGKGPVITEEARGPEGSSLGIDGSTKESNSAVRYVEGREGEEASSKRPRSPSMEVLSASVPKKPRTTARKVSTSTPTRFEPSLRVEETTGSPQPTLSTQETGIPISDYS